MRTLFLCAALILAGVVTLARADTDPKTLTSEELEGLKKLLEELRSRPQAPPADDSDSDEEEQLQPVSHKPASHKPVAKSGGKQAGLSKSGGGGGKQRGAAGSKRAPHAKKGAEPRGKTLKNKQLRVREPRSPGASNQRVRGHQ